MDKKIERITVDGRRTEVCTAEQPLEGATQRVTEYFEEIIPFEKKKKITELVVPVIMERVTEQYDGNQINKTVEKVAGEDLSLRLTRLTPINHPLTTEDVEVIVRKAISDKPSFWGNLFRKPATVIGPTPPPNLNNNAFISYVLITALAIEIGFMVWQLFIR